MYKSATKPFFDFTCALIGLIVISPVFILLAALLFIFQNGKVFFKQDRPGYNERIFKVIKFKTMTDQRNAQGELLSDSDRLTWVGRFVRKTSLDEIPQLINVLKGDMSFVGPRPWLVEYLPLYTPEQRRRHKVKPGITGWAQINGRNQLKWETRFEHDLWYVDNQSFLLDLKILFLTVLKVFKAEGVSSKESVTMEKFTGNNKN